MVKRQVFKEDDKAEGENSRLLIKLLLSDDYECEVRMEESTFDFNVDVCSHRVKKNVCFVQYIFFVHCILCAISDLRFVHEFCRKEEKRRKKKKEK